MSIKKPSKFLVIGVDAALPDLIQQFSQEGVIPNITNLLKRGIFSRVVSTFPPLTATAWASIVTGAGPGTSGLPSLMVHLPGEKLDKWHTSFDQRLLKAETLWEAGARAGKRAALINWPVTWPQQKLAKGLQIGASLNPPFRFFYMPLWDIASSSLFSTKRYACNQVPGRAVVVKPKQAEGWLNLPDSKKTPLEFKITVPPVYAPGVSYYVAIIDTRKEGYDEILISPSKNANDSIAHLRENQKSDWVTEVFKGDKETHKGKFYFYLAKLDKNAQALKLYVSAISSAEKYTFPEELTEEIEAVAGPYMEVDDPWAYMDRWVDLEFYMDQLQAHVDWWTKTTSYVLERKEWDMAFSYVFTIDHLQHILYGGIDPKSRHYEPKKKEMWLDYIRRAYIQVDKGIGNILKNVDLNETLILLVSDHGFSNLDWNPYLKKYLAEKGLISYKLNTDTGEIIIDWSQTKCFPLEPCHAHIFVNLKGRDPDGIVNPEDYQKVQEEIIDALMQMRDPETGERMVSVAIRRKEANTLGIFEGPGFDRIGDVLFALKPGYMANPFIYPAAVQYKDGTKRIIPNPENVEPATMTRDFSGIHLTLPTLREMHAAMVLSGPGILQLSRKQPIRSIDIAPTVAHILGIPVPKDAEGEVIRDVLK
ncbi:alkaline phosphatase family protein [Patescibacteria group bacterium]|nr:alkaline phosphatase family protein [Patescibacteria group bacterium]